MSTDAALTITEFLLARITEDEAVAQAAAAGKNERRMDISFPDPAGNSWTADQGMVSGEGKWNTLWDCEGAESLCTAPSIADHIARHDPARVLAECAAKRAIVSLADEALEAEVKRRDASALGANLMHSDALRALAAVYSDHPDYQQEWALDGAR